MAEAWELLETLLGLDRDVGDVDVVQMALRTLLVYGATLAIVRLGSKRFLSRATAFDVVVAIMFGSIVGRAINGSAPFFPTLAAGLVLVGLHWAFAALAFHTYWFGAIVKGSRRPQVAGQGGRPLRESGHLQRWSPTGHGAAKSIERADFRCGGTPVAPIAGRTR